MSNVTEFKPSSKPGPVMVWLPLIAVYCDPSGTFTKAYATHPAYQPEVFGVLGSVAGEDVDIALGAWRSSDYIDGGWEVDVTLTPKAAK